MVSKKLLLMFAHYRKILFLFCLLCGIGLYLMEMKYHFVLNENKLIFGNNPIKEKLNVQSTFHSNITDTNMSLLQSISSKPALNMSRTMKPKNDFYLKEPTIFSSKCWENPCQNKTNFTMEIKWRMGIFVKTAASHSAFRAVLRSTWKPISYVNNIQIFTAFLIGLANEKTQPIVDEESKQHGDILQLNLSDSYRNLPAKTLGGIQWAIENMIDQDFYLSTDDDVILYLGDIVNLIKKWMSQKGEKDFGQFPIHCLCGQGINVLPIRDPKRKYFISKKEYKWTFYPDYCFGPGYMTSVSVARQLYHESQKFEKAEVYLEDIWITGNLRNSIGMPRQLIRNSQKRFAHHHFGYRDVRDKVLFAKREAKKLWDSLKNKSTCTCRNYIN